MNLPDDSLPSTLEVPLFPLPEVLLFPTLDLPLRIFEPRYKKMLEDAIAGEKLIAMAILKGDWESQYTGQPEVCSTVTIGRITHHQPFEEENFLITLKGLARGEILSEDQSRVYRKAKVRLLPESIPREEWQEVLLLYKEILQIWGKVALPEQKKNMPNPPPGATEREVIALSYRIAGALRVESPVKEKLLVTNSVLERLTRQLPLLKELLHIVKLSPRPEDNDFYGFSRN